ncbi:MAG: T9SS type A sorting domain-containing protein [Bacteroidetes bacterium]|nr:MAG: T9SS type A sorting domain-containing protein [Bacteroidota bacterium]
MEDIRFNLCQFFQINYSMLKTLFSIIALVSCSFVFGQQVSGGHHHSLALCPDGTLKAFGDNSAGQLGIGNHLRKILPEPVPNFTDITAIECGQFFNLYLKNDGTVWGCGSVFYGQLGIDNLTPPNEPVMINGLTGIIAIAAGENHSLFLKNDSTVWACGINNTGQLGIGNYINQKVPAQIPNLTGVKAIVAGVHSSFFIKNDGTVWACGKNHIEDTERPTPELLSGLNGVIAISSGDWSTLFLKNDSTVWYWGENTCGQAGIGKAGLVISPTQVPNLNGVKAISTRDKHCLFLKNDGTVWACGNNIYGELGIGNNVSQFIPVQVKNLTGITSIFAGSIYSLFVKNNSSIWACGYNKNGQLGLGNKINQTEPQYIGEICAPPDPPTVDMSNFPTSVCLGSNLNVTPNISGSNPVFTVHVDNSIQVNNPKAITKNSNAVFVLNDNDAIARYGFDGKLTSCYPNLNISGIKAFAADDNSNVYLFNGDGKIYKCDSTGTLLNTQSVLWQSTTANQLVFTTPVDPTSYPENLFLIDAQRSSGNLITGINTFDNDLFSNSNLYPSYPEPPATSMSIDNFYGNKRALLANPTNSTLHSRILYPPSGITPDYKNEYLVDSAATAGMALDFISADTLFSFFTVSSSTTGVIGTGQSYLNSDGSPTNYIDTSLTSTIKPVTPVGIITTPFGSAYQFWVADRGQNRILRVFGASYQITPKLPEGLWYNSTTGQIEGTPVKATAPQTYQVKITTPYGTDSTLFTFGVTNPTGLKNAAGSGASEGEQKDGLTIKYYDANNCEKLIDIADSLGGTSPGYTKISQTVYPVVSVIANDKLIRRATQINADNIDTLKVEVTFYYTFDDIELYKQSTGSSISNDTVAGTMQMAVLQMHELPNGGREPIIHSPITAKWISADKNWKAVVPVTKFSEFYAGDTTTIQNFDCTNDSSISLTVSNNFYVWNYDTLFTSKVYIDTLVNATGCDSVVTLDLTLKPNGISEYNLASGILVYPNPSNGTFNIRFENNDDQIRSIRVTNLMGQQVYQTTLTSSSAIDLSNQSNGVYFISIEAKDGLPIVFRVIKM